MNHYPYHQRISDQRDGAEENGLSDHHRKHGQIHRVTHPSIGSLGDEELWRIDRSRRSLSDEGERTRAPEVEAQSQKEREDTKQPGRWTDAPRGWQKKRGNQVSARSWENDREDERLQSDHECSPFSLLRRSVGEQAVIYKICKAGSPRIGFLRGDLREPQKQ